ncbi:hypothetical protein V5799_018019 [Amblyomma americanum]|uniref:Uncharacterized protein n=1 Tax=Amblyomma americanum TaxID=6943 RepID=A0AAQ4F1F8_AMBAM
MDQSVLQNIACLSDSTVHRLHAGQFALASLDWQDTFVGVLLLGISLLTLCVCLILMVKLLHSMLRGRIAVVIKTTVNAEYRFPFSVLVGYIAILLGCIMTILVQSSSIFTSALTPLAGIGVISLERIYPLTLGSNIGTTTTGILAALAADSSRIKHTLQISFCHLFFNVLGILMFYPLPFTRIPIQLAKILGNTTAKYRWFSVLYLICMFLLFPAAVFGLSMAGTVVFMVVLIPLLFVALVVIVVNVLQRKVPHVLPERLRNWLWLPEWMRSLDPLDRAIAAVVGRCGCCQRLCPPQTAHDASAMPTMREVSSQMNFIESRRSSCPSDSQSDLQAFENSAFNWTKDKQNGGATFITQL